MEERIKVLKESIEKILKDIANLENVIEIKKAMLLSIQGGISELQIQVDKNKEEE